jgi:RimJ/RimL family protein N-acetyltransferase
MIVTGPDIAKWAEARMGGYGFDNPMGFGIIRQDKLVGAVVYDNYRPAAKSVFVSIALDYKAALTKPLIAQVFNYAFYDLGCNRIQAMIDENNHPSLELCRRLGFSKEGELREASPSGSNLFLFALLKRENRWSTRQSSDTSHS